MANGIMGRFYKQREPESREHLDAAELSLVGAVENIPAQLGL